MKFLLLPLALGAVLAGCATYAPAPMYVAAPYQYHDPVTGTVQAWDPASAVYPPYVYPYPSPYPYPYAYPYYGGPYWDPFWLTGGAFFACCAGAHHHDHLHHHMHGPWQGGGMRSAHR
jgi:hypothetical protein